MKGALIRRCGFAVVALVLVACVSSRAEANCALPPVLLLVPLLPSEAGVDVSRAGDVNGVIGWSWQLALAQDPFRAANRHRIVTGVDLLVGPDGVSGRGRIGYRYALGDFFAGVGPAVDGSGVSLSPELGVKFAHAAESHREVDASLHVLARAHIAPDGVRGATVLLGWNLL